MKEAPSVRDRWQRSPEKRPVLGHVARRVRLRDTNRICQSCPNFELELSAGEMRVLAKSTLSLVPGQSGNPRVPFNPRAKCLGEFPATERAKTQALRHSSPFDAIEILTREHLSPRLFHLSVLCAPASAERFDVGSRRAGVEIRSQGLDERGHRLPPVQSPQRKSHTARGRDAALERAANSIVATGRAARFPRGRRTRRVAPLPRHRLKVSYTFSLAQRFLKKVYDTFRDA